MRPPPRHARPREVLPAWVAWIGVALLTGTSLFLGFYDLAVRSLWLDEGYTWLTSDQKTGVIFDIARTQGWHLVPYYLLIHATISMFGDSPVALRAPSVVAGALAVPFLYALGTRLGGRVAALSACLLFVVSEPLVFWQQNARDYSLVVLIAVLGTWAGVVGLQTARIWVFAAWAVVMGIGCYTHPEVLFLVPVQIAVFLLWGPSARVRITVIALVVVGALCSIPTLENAAHSNVYQVTFLSPPNNGSATEIASFVASAAASAGAVTSVNHALLGITFFLMVIGVAMLGSDLADRGCRRENLGLGLGLGWTVTPMLLAWIVSETGRQSFTDRYVIVSLPGAALLLAQIADRLQPKALGLFAVVYLTIFHAGLVAGNYHAQIDDYRDSTQMILTTAHPGDCLTFQSNDGRTLYDYYAARLSAGHRTGYFSPRQVMPSAVNGQPFAVLQYSYLTIGQLYNAQQPATVAALTHSCSRVFIMESHYGTPTGPTSQVQKYVSLEHLTDDLRAYYKTQTIKEYPGVFVQVFERTRVAG